MPVFDPPIKEEILGGGYVLLEEMLGDDLTPARVARISYLSEGDEEANRKLLIKLLEMKHFSPFEQQVFRFKIEGIPMYIGEQLLRHRIASPLKRSFRYTSPDKGTIIEYTPEGINRIVHIPPEFFELRESHIENKEKLLKEVISHIKNSIELYQKLVEAGLRKEAARTVLPAGLRTSLYWTINMRSLMNFLEQRLSPKAQWEMRQLAKAVVRILYRVVPLTIDNFLKISGLEEYYRD
ncbi:MAG: FAD-dependent thymidylate synthase [candidate division WOR-3 bacterium]|jgi:thymidylate synthase (FAD)